ncbi:MAG: hypothetical protein ACRETI_10090 [Steroidobacteraceae bacterium]
MNRTLRAVLSFVLAGAASAAASGAEPPSATIVAIEGHIVTIADAAGQKKHLEVVDAKGLAPGSRISWCEDDCRVLRTADRSIQVRRVLEAKP